MCNITINCCSNNSEEQSKKIIIPFGEELIFKTTADGNQEELEEGDYVFKIINGQVESGFYKGGDKEDANNYN